MQNRFQWVFDYYEFWNRGFGKVLSINVGDDGDIDLALGKTAVLTDLPNRFLQKHFKIQFIIELRYPFRPVWEDLNTEFGSSYSYLEEILVEVRQNSVAELKNDYNLY